MNVRQKKVAGRIREILSDLFLFTVKDPRLSGLTVTEVTVDRELFMADVYVNALGDEERRDEVMEALERARGFLRYHTGRRLDLRRTPELRFHWDDTFARAERLSQLLESLVEEDDEVETEVNEDDSPAP